MPRSRPVGAVLISLSLCGALAPGARAEVGINTLRGIHRVKVVIEDLTSDSTDRGLTEQALRDQTEQALRQIRIQTVDSGDPSAKSSFTPVLYVAIAVERIEGFHTFLIQLDLLQAVSLRRDPAIEASTAATWSVCRFGRVGEKDYAGRVRAMLTRMLQSFQDDYLSMNPAAWPPAPLSTSVE